MSVSTRFGARPMARAATVAAALGLTVATAGCSGGPSGQDQAALPQGQAPGAVSPATSAAAGRTSQMSVRFGNFFTSNGKPGPAVDIYDTQPGQAASPLLTDVAYGSVSAYVHPNVPANSLPNQVIATFYALPAGENPVAGKADGQGVGGVEDDGSHPQITLLLEPSSGSSLSTGPLAGLSFSTRVEKGDDNGSKAPVAPAPPSGQGQILVETSAVTDLQTGSLGLYLISDRSCSPPVNGDPNAPGVPLIFNSDSAAIQSAFAIFPTAPGVHQVSVVAWTSTTPPTCAQLTRKQGATSISITAGQQVEAYVYGTSLTDLQLAAAPIQR